MTLQTWLENNHLSFQFEKDNILLIHNFGKCLVLSSEKLFNEDFHLQLTEEEYELADSIDYVVYEWGSRWYYSNKLEKPTLTELKYVGKSNLLMGEIDFPYLGIHGGFDLCNGSRLYTDWCKKAKFLNISTLGICEENTLAGVISFQSACEKSGIKSIIGESVRFVDEQGNYFYLKFYCKDRETGWRNLLVINSKLKLNNEETLVIKDLKGIGEGLICVIFPDVSLELVYTELREIFLDNLYYSFDLTEWDSQDRDELYLVNLEDYLRNYKEKLKHILISDSYYLELEDSPIRRILHLIGHQNFKNQSKNQFFKTIDDFFLEGFELFTKDEELEDLLIEGIKRTIEVFSFKEFKVITGKFYLPKYEMSSIEEESFRDNEDLLRDYIRIGLEKKVLNNTKRIKIELYKERAERELDVIKRGGFIDYFLILADLYNFCKREGIWFGIGRGSAAGCLVSYLCDIVDVDPVEYNLLFERFLNEGRLGKSLPDVDCDFQGERRTEIKEYLENKYGKDYVMSIGTFGTFKLKNAVKDISRTFGIDHTSVNYVTSLFPDPQQQTQQQYHELFQCSLQSQRHKLVYSFIQKYPEVIEKIPLILSQPKNASIHAAGFVIVPKEFGTLFKQLPVKKVEDLLVSEWEGHFIEEAGFLKIDILGIKQLDKFSSISKLIQKNKNKVITFKDIELDDDRVFEMFRTGSSEDVFQFTGIGLKGYCKELQPDNIEDLIATVALYRPGPMESQTHKKYINVKNGYEKPNPDPGCEEITKTTFGLIVYQEQVMQICQHVANFSLVEADDIRKGLGKMKKEIVEKYQEEFLIRSIKNGYKKEDMLILWEKMSAFAAYAFNRSHAACYAITGYYSQWFKVHYPIEFWTISLQYSDDKEKEGRIAEIYKTSVITVSSVDINQSSLDFIGDVKTNSIYWSLTSVKWVGDKVVETILEEREKNGSFYSIEEFYSRTKKAGKINKRAINHLIICGGFDRIEGIKKITERYSLLEKFYLLHSTSIKKFEEDFEEMKNWREHQWVLKQKELTGFGFFDFKQILHQSTLVSKINKYKDIVTLLVEEVNEQKVEEVLCCGLLIKLIERSYQTTKKLGQLEIKDNGETIFVTLWDEKYQEFKDLLKTSEGKIIVLNANITWDDYKKRNSLVNNKNTKIEII